MPNRPTKRDPSRAVSPRKTTGLAGRGRAKTPSAPKGGADAPAAGDPKLKGLDKAVALVTDGSSVGPSRPSAKPVDYSGIRCLRNPVWCYNGFIIAVAALTLFGLMMVFSSSTVDLVAQGKSPWTQIMRQGGYAVVGLVVGIVLSRIPVKAYRRLSSWALIVAILLQLLTLIPGVGKAVGGNTGWIVLGPVQFQPAEVVKWSLCIWMPAAVLASRAMKLQGLRAYLVPIAGFLASFCAVLGGGDLGTGMIVLLIGATALWVGGFPFKWFVGLGVAGCIGIVIVFVTRSGNRMSRILAAYGECSGDDLKGVCYQAVHGAYAMASGGFTGVGLGNSREKWNYLPEAHNDFIFAIIGEELGFLGACAVILCFAVIGWCLINIAMRHKDSYARMVMSCVTMWIVGQALVNIAVVIGLLPVMGLPMPFVSAGGTALIMCLVASGTAMSMARCQSDIRESVARA